eukprot:2082409-Ditylum_brightwellii.AAC.1
MCETIIKKLKYAGSYQDDGLAIFDERKTVTWLRDFQLLVDEVVVGGTVPTSNSQSKFGSHLKHQTNPPPLMNLRVTGCRQKNGRDGEKK